MKPMQIDILNPKVKKLLQALASLDVISIREVSTNDFAAVLARLRSESVADPGTDEITREVEMVRSGPASAAGLSLTQLQKVMYA